MAGIPIFGKHLIPDGESAVFSHKNFSLVVKRENDGWLFLQQNKKISAKNLTSDFSDAEFFKTGKSNTLHFLPALPEIPLVFKGDNLHITSGQKLTFFLKLPLNIQVCFSKPQPENMIKEISPVKLTNTWFGEPHDGEPAFALNTGSWQSPDELDLSPFEAICPVTIHNNFAGVLEVERLIIRVENMTLYKVAGRLTTSLLAVEYKGKTINSSAKYNYSKAFHGEKPEVVVKPRTVTENNLKKINFFFIKNLYRQES